jgi:hypothetical protein
MSYKLLHEEMSESDMDLAGTRQGDGSAGPSAPTSVPKAMDYPPPYTEGSDGRGFQSFPNAPQQVVYQQPTVVYVQPPPLENPPDDFLCQSIFATICCCWCIGIVAILKSVDCRSAIATGNRQRAEESSREAKKYTYITVGVGAALIVAYVIMQVVVMSIASGHH